MAQPWLAEYSTLRKSLFLVTTRSGRYASSPQDGKEADPHTPTEASGHTQDTRKYPSPI
jgi:hypothetical protein